MNYNLTELQIVEITNALKEGKELPEMYKWTLFPTQQAEYELVYANKWSTSKVLSDTEESKAVPLQLDKEFILDKKDRTDWRNMIIFGDNLQILKNFYQDQDPIIQGQVKGKVKLIYIDPPFATTDEFSKKDGAKAYSDKKKGAEFVEWLRRRLIVAREIMAEDGLIYVHLDQKMSHYIKITMDEVFGKNNFKNEIVWHYTGNSVPVKNFPKKHDNILLYSKSDNVKFNFSEVLEPYSDLTVKRYNHVDEQGRKYKVSALRNGKQEIIYAKEGKYPDDVWNIPVPRSKDELTDYPTQKPEVLLEKIIKSSTNQGDIVMDFFGGSGTCISTAEKLNRRWITCDIGKLAIYTMQKRMLTVQNTKKLDGSNNKYGNQAKPFAVYNSGIYDLEQTLKPALTDSAKQQEYVEFVKGLFELEPTDIEHLNGIKIDGIKRTFYTMVWKYWEYNGGDIIINEEYIANLHNTLGSTIDTRFYIIAPENCFNSITSYIEHEDVKFYFLKVPYQIIKELHKINFKLPRQPQSSKKINDLDNAIGFHFKKEPEVKSEIIISSDKKQLKITEFKSGLVTDEEEKILENFETLAMILFDYDYNEEHFIMDHTTFANEVINKTKNKNSDEEKDEDEEKDVRSNLAKRSELIIPLPSFTILGEKIAIKYIDIFGNEFTEIKLI